MLAGEPIDLIDEPDGRDGDVTMTQAEAVRIVKQRDGLHHRIVIVKRLAHSHEDDVGDPFLMLGQPAREEPRLIEDLAGRKISIEATLPGRAEGTGERAAGLRR